MYQLSGNLDFISRLNSDGTVTHLRVDPANTDYAAYLAWLAEGNEPLPAPEPPVPPVLTPEQKLANAGLTVDELKTLLGLD